MSLRCSFGLDSRKVCFKGQLTLGDSICPLLPLWGALSSSSSLFLTYPILSYANEPATMLKLFRTLLLGRWSQTLRIRSVHSTHPPSLRRVQMHYLGRLASNGRILCPHSKAKLYIFRVAFSLSCLLRALPPMRNVFSCILERPLHPFQWSRQKFWLRHRAEHRPPPFKLVFYCRVPFPVFPRHYSPRLFHHPFRPSFASTVT